ncbi:MAG TPA: hypothetical protein VFV34_26030 [Blastocatellia bacterium]|nr:hypothetical protein [Blastocatellia bacterium]
MTSRVLVMSACLMSALPFSGCGVEDRTDLEVTAPTTTLRIGETVQLSVIRRLPNGSTLDLTSPGTGTVYHTTSEAMLIPEPDGRVTCIGTNGKDEESAVIGAGNGEHHGHIRFKLVASGFGPGLEVTADKTQLREGEKAQLHVFKSLPDGNRNDLTAASSGTRYLTFAGSARPDSSVITISDSGFASAAESIGSYNYRTVIVFVRNADSTGWIELKVVHKSVE